MLLPEPECPTKATDSFSFILRLKFLKINLFLEGYLNDTFSNTIVPFYMVLLVTWHVDFTSIRDFSSIIPNTSLADFFALLIEGICDTATPAPIAPTNIMYTAVNISLLASPVIFPFSTMRAAK